MQQTTSTQNKNKQVISVNSFNINDIIFTNPKVNKDKRLTAGILNSRTNSGCFFQIPACRAPFGITSYGESDTYSVAVKAVGGENENPEEVLKCFTNFKQIDEKAIDYLIKHSQAIFKKLYTSEQKNIIEDLLYNKCVKPSIGEDGTIYPDKITLKIMKKEDNTPDVQVYKKDDKNLKKK